MICRSYARITVLHGGGARWDVGTIPPDPACYLIDTDIVRASERQHPIQGRSSDGNLGRLGLVGARSKRIAITRLYRPIDVSTLARRLYPLAFCHADAAPFGGHPQVTVALCRGALGRGTHNRACPWRHDDDSVWMTLGNRLADPPVLIVIAVGGEGSDAIGYLVEKRVNQRTIIDFILGHLDGDDLAAVGIDTNSGRPPPRRPRLPRRGPRCVAFSGWFGF